MSQRTFNTHREGRVLTIEFDNPPRHYMDARMSLELGRVIEGIEHDGSYIAELGAPGDPAGHIKAWEKLRAGSLVKLVGRS